MTLLGWVGILWVVVVLVGYACLVVSGKQSRREEKRSMKPFVSAEDVRTAVKIAGITEVPIRECSICGEQIRYIIAEGQLFLDSNCGCSTMRSPLQPRGFNDISDALNRNIKSPEWDNIAERWGIHDLAGNGIQLQPAHTQPDSNFVAGDASTAKLLRASWRRNLIAKACHEAWYCYTMLGLREEGEPWDTAPGWQKESIKSAVDFWDICPKMSLQELCEASHLNWTREKFAQGWVYGKVKDAALKTHPCLAPYDNLPVSQKLKDEVVVRIYLALREIQ